MDLWEASPPTVNKVIALSEIETKMSYEKYSNHKRIPSTNGYGNPGTRKI